jgi:hypothetical protein
MHYATPNCITLLHSARADVHPINNQGVSPLFRAAKEGRLDVVVKLLECGAPADGAKDADEEKVIAHLRPPNVAVTPLTVACMNSQFVIVRTLLSASASPWSEGRWTGNGGDTAFKTAISFGKLNCVRELMQYHRVSTWEGVGGEGSALMVALNTCVTAVQRWSDDLQNSAEISACTQVLQLLWHELSHEKARITPQVNMRASEAHAVFAERHAAMRKMMRMDPSKKLGIQPVLVRLSSLMKVSSQVTDAHGHAETLESFARKEEEAAAAAAALIREEEEERQRQERGAHGGQQARSANKGKAKTAIAEVVDNGGVSQSVEEDEEAGTAADGSARRKSKAKAKVRAPSRHDEDCMAVHDALLC